MSGSLSRTCDYQKVEKMKNKDMLIKQIVKIMASCDAIVIGAGSGLSLQLDSHTLEKDLKLILRILL